MQAGSSSQAAAAAGGAAPSPPPPPRTYGAAVQQARAALRRFREARAAGAAPKRDPEAPWRLTLDLPLPVASDIADRGLADWQDAPFGVADEGDWPGGQLQRFRAFRRVAEALLEGYDSTFLGMLESPADGLGVWQLPEAVVCGIVANATFAPFAKLCDGGFGAQPTRADQAVVAAAEWTRSADIGQPWDRGLRARARALIDEAEWAPLYRARLVRTSKGAAFGLLVAAYGEPWRLWAADGDTSDTVVDGAPPLLEVAGLEEPPAAAIVAALNEAAERQRAAGLVSDDAARRRRGPLWW